MSRSKKKRDPIPEHFKTLDEAAEFWDSHDLTDYWDQTSEANFEVDLQRRVFLTAFGTGISQELG